MTSYVFYDFSLLPRLLTLLTPLTLRIIYIYITIGNDPYVWGHVGEIVLAKADGVMNLEERLREYTPESTPSTSEEHLNDATAGLEEMTVKEEDGAK